MSKLKVPSSRLLAVRRAALGKTVSGVAREAGITRGYAHLIEARKYMPSDEVLEKLADQYQIEKDALRAWILEGME